MRIFHPLNSLVDVIYRWLNLQWLDLNRRPWGDEASVVPQSNCCWQIFILCQKQSLDSNPWSHHNDSSVLPLCYCFWKQFVLLIPFSFTWCQGSDWTWTLDLSVMMQVFYHCATAAGKIGPLNAIFIHLVPAAVIVLIPLTLVWWCRCSTTVLLCYCF